MEWDKVLNEAVIKTELKSANREDAIRELVGGMVDAAVIDADAAVRVVDALIRRERLGSTAIGGGVSIPHARVDVGSNCVTALGRSAGGIDWGAIDSSPVHVVLLVVTRADSSSQHLRTLAHVSRLLSRPRAKNALLAATSEDALREALVSAETARC
jgi:PTS system nitrogen regulatory IIA component